MGSDAKNGIKPWSEYAGVLVDSLANRLLFGNCPAQITPEQKTDFLGILSQVDVSGLSKQGSLPWVELPKNSYLIGNPEPRKPRLFLNFRRIILSSACKNYSVPLSQQATFFADFAVSAWASNRIIDQMRKDPQMARAVFGQGDYVLLAKLIRADYVSAEVNRARTNILVYATKETPVFAVEGLTPADMTNLSVWERNPSSLSDRVRYRGHLTELKSCRLSRGEYLQATGRTEQDEKESFI